MTPCHSRPAFGTSSGRGMRSAVLAVAAAGCNGQELCGGLETR